MLVILFLLLQGEPAPFEIASVVDRQTCDELALRLNRDAHEPKLRFGCYERKPTSHT